MANRSAISGDIRAHIGISRMQLSLRPASRTSSSSVSADRATHAGSGPVPLVNRPTLFSHQAARATDDPAGLLEYWKADPVLALTARTELRAVVAKAGAVSGNARATSADVPALSIVQLPPQNEAEERQNDENPLFLNRERPVFHE